MNKTAIKNFAIRARVQLIEAVKQRAFEYDITENGENQTDIDAIGGRPLTIEEKKQRQQLIEEINRKSYTQVMEEAAYTWFNRFIALRFMEVNGFLPSKVRVFTDENGAFKPELLKDAITVDIDGLDRSKIMDLLDRQDNEELYKYLLITQCNALNQGLPYMFEKISNWTELLFPANLLRPDSVLGQMVTEIPEEDWQDAVQIIGWMYQYYNSELKDDTFALLKKNVKITKERIPAATQLFTPDWIVRYMVENSLGRLYINDQLSVGSYQSEAERVAAEKALAEKMGWKYYLPEAEQDPEVRAQLNALMPNAYSLTTLKVIDPCMGSGHILVYAFDMLLQIYTSCGWSERDAAKSIIENNLYGLDIDDRAGQLAYFAVMMKARKYSRRILNGETKPNVFAIQDSGFMTDDFIAYVAEPDKQMEADLTLLRSTLRDAKEYGSIINMPKLNFAALYERIDIIRRSFAEDIFQIGHRSTTTEQLLPLVKQAEIMAQKYDVVVTNPPYMGGSGMTAKLGDYVKENFPDGKADLFAVFIERCSAMTKAGCYTSMITMQAWMYLSSFEQIRFKILSESLESLIRIGYNSFPELNSQVAHACAFIIKKQRVNNYKGIFFELNTGKVTDDKERVFTEKKKKGEYYVRSKNDFMLIPGIPLAFVLSDNIIKAFESQKLSDVARPRQGLATGENNRFLRLWYECSNVNVCYCARSIQESIQSQAKWFPYNKGGDFRKWYGNNDYLVNWENDGYEIRNFYGDNGKLRSRPQNTEAYFKEGVTWSKIATDTLAFRYKPYGHIFDVAGTSFFAQHDRLIYLQGLCNSCVAMRILKTISPTVNFEVGHIAALPVIQDTEKKGDVKNLVEDCVSLSEIDWDAFETSWAFKKHPLV